MSKQSLLEQLEEWQEDGENEKIVAAILVLPEEVLDARIMYILAKAYLEIGEPKKAVAVMEGLREAEENTFDWQLRMGIVLFNTAKDDEECRDDPALRTKIIENAKDCIVRAMTLNTHGDEMSDMLDELMSRADALLGGDFDDSDDMDVDDLELYDEEELDALEEHINEYYGDFPSVFHEIASEDIHVDVVVIPPERERNYFTLITMGMGARRMNIPDDADEDLDRAELVMCLPPDWKVGNNSDKWFWPIGLLKSLARLPIDCDTWLGWGHSVDNGYSFAENTDLCGSLLIYPEGVEEGAEKCTLPNGDIVSFYQVIPIYREEMDFKMMNGTKELLEKLTGSSNHIVDISRPNVCEDFYYTDLEFDIVQRHSGKIFKNRFPLDPICGCSHIAIFVRWCIEHDLMNPGFYEQCPEFARDVRSGKTTDVRRFVIDVMDGRLDMFHFSYAGANFLKIYYSNDFDWKYSYFNDVDAYAENYFGTEKYNCEEFRDEAYLFVPFDEQYYRGMSQYIQRAYDCFIGDFAAYREEEGRGILKALSDKLGIEAQIVMPDSELFFRIKSGLPESGGEKTDIPTLVCDCGLCATAEDAEEALFDGLIPYLHTYALAAIPRADPMEWVKERFAETDDRREASDTYEQIFGMYGSYPWLLTYDSDTPDKLALFIRDGGGNIVRYNYIG